MDKLNTIDTLPKYNVQIRKATNREELQKLDTQYRNNNFMEILPFSYNTAFVEIAEKIGEGKNQWKYPFLYIISTHPTSIGAKTLCRQASNWYEKESNKVKMDVLSISSGMEDDKLRLKVLIRCYNNPPAIEDFFKETGTSLIEEEKKEEVVKGKFKTLTNVSTHELTEEELVLHKKRYEEQKKFFDNATEEKPFLNQIDTYVPKTPYNPLDYTDTIYDLKDKYSKISLVTPREQYDKVFREIMNYVSGIEYYHYASVMTGDESEEDFMKFIISYIQDNYVNHGTFAAEDVPTLSDQVYNALFKLYVLQDLIDDPDVTDIKVTAPDSIRCRIKGKAYLSNVTFVDLDDYLRFICGICLRNGIRNDRPEQSFTYSHDEDYILRITLSSEYINADEWPYLHVRKVSRKKLLGDDLIKNGMFDAKVRDYLLDCGRESRGVVFAGPPGSGKTVCLNWFLEEAYEQSAEILCIQENDELFAYRKGVMFQHVVNHARKDKPSVSLEELAKLALVAGANVFIIGETKGGEICSAITLSNSGCRTATTIHSQSSTETIDKMADLAMRGISQDYIQAKRSLKSFQTIVYLQDFKVQEISEIIGFDEEKKDMIYRCIYRRED